MQAFDALPDQEVATVDVAVAGLPEREILTVDAVPVAGRRLLRQLWVELGVPKVAFAVGAGLVSTAHGPYVFDIRRQNMLEHLMYKAMFELAADRPAFMSLLWNRSTPVLASASSLARVPNCRTTSTRE